MSQNLLSPIVTDYVDMDLNWLNSFSKKQTQRSWYSVKLWKNKMQQGNSQMIFSQSVTTSWPKIMECVQQKIEEEERQKKEKEKKKEKKKETNQKKLEKIPAGKSKRIRLFPTPKQRETLVRWFGTTRWTFNKCIDAIQKEGIKINKKELRANCLNSELFETENTWVKETPYDGIFVFINF